jgi:hypothetical protein
MTLLYIILAIIFSPVLIALAVVALIFLMIASCFVFIFTAVVIVFIGWCFGMPFHVKNTVGDTVHVTVYRWTTPIKKYTEPAKL